jgi:hypothetical protein
MTDTSEPPIHVTIGDVIRRLKAVPAKSFLRIPTGTPLISAELPIGELCHEAATALELLEGHHNEAHRRERENPSPDSSRLEALIYSALQVLEPIADRDWDGKWRIQKALAFLKADDVPSEIRDSQKLCEIRQSQSNKLNAMSSNFPAPSTDQSVVRTGMYIHDDAMKQFRNADQPDEYTAFQRAIERFDGPDDCGQYHSDSGELYWLWGKAVEWATKRESSVPPDYIEALEYCQFLLRCKEFAHFFGPVAKWGDPAACLAKVDAVLDKHRRRGSE